eukprot:3338080-Prymnesium_polylepis.1
MLHRGRGRVQQSDTRPPEAASGALCGRACESSHSTRGLGSTRARRTLVLRRTRALDELRRLERKLLREELLDGGVVEAEGDVHGRAVAEEVDQLEQLELLVPAELLDERFDEAARELMQ